MSENHYVSLCTVHILILLSNSILKYFFIRIFIYPIYRQNKLTSRYLIQTNYYSNHFLIKTIWKIHMSNPNISLLTLTLIPVGMCKRNNCSEISVTYIKPFL